MENGNKLEKIGKSPSNNELKKEQNITLINKKDLSITGTTKIISLKPDLIQLETVYGGIIVSGENMELIRLDDLTTKAEISGEINSIRFIEVKNKEPFFRKIFK